MINTLFPYAYLKICVYCNDKQFDTEELNAVNMMEWNA